MKKIVQDKKEKEIIYSIKNVISMESASIETERRVEQKL
jgi:hypothetical protein